MLIFLGLAGLAVGSFLNVVIDRLPREQSLVYPPSHCDGCHHPLAPWDLVPLFSYLWLRGRCRYCRASIPRRLPLVELATGLAFAYLGWRYGLSLLLPLSLIYYCLFAAIFVIDLEHQVIPNQLLYPGLALALGFSFLWPGLGPVRALVGGAAGFVALLLPYLLSRGGMGEGDVKLAGLIGLATGFPLVLLTLLLGILTGGVMAVILLVLRLKARKEAIPFGPFLAGAAVVAIFWGELLSRWYSQFFWH